MSEIYGHILETHSQILELNADFPANDAKDTIQMKNSTAVSQNYQKSAILKHRTVCLKGLKSIVFEILSKWV